MKKVYLLAGESGYDVFRFWLEKLRVCFAERGWEAQVIPVKQETEIPENAECVTLSFNLIRLWRPELTQRRHIIWMVDPPPYHGQFFAHSLTGMPVVEKKCPVFCVDADWVELARDFYGYRNICFLPHAASVEQPVDAASRQVRYEVLFAGSLQHPDFVLDELRERAGGNWPVMRQVLDMALESPPGTLGRIISHFSGQFLMDRDKALHFMNIYYPLIDRYIRNRRRLEMVQSVRDFRVHIFGAGDWHRVVLPGNITIEHPVPFGRVSELMQQSRVVLNCSPSHAGGAHERIFDAVMCGAAVVTTPSSYVSRLFSGESAVRAGASANEAVHEFMNQPERTNRQVGLSQQIVCQNHRFGNRVDELLKAFEYRS